MNDNEKIVFLVPCYNCGPAIKTVVDGIRPYAYRILVINDGCTDESPQYIMGLETDKLEWDKNRGKGYTLIQGFKHLLKDDQWNAVITIDSDGQHHPQDVNGFINKWKETKSDIIIGYRDFCETKVPIQRRWANQLSSSIISSLFGYQLHDIQCGYRLYTRKSIEKLLPLIASHAYAIETEMTLLALRMGFSISEVKIQCIYDDESSKRSAWRPLIDTLQIFKVVLKYRFFFKG